MSQPSLGSTYKPSKNQREAGSKQSLFIVSEDGGDIFHEMSVEFQQTTWRYIPENRTLHNHRCENLKSYDHFSAYNLPPLFVRCWAGIAQSV
jgi:hypothetical protein